MRQPDRGFGPPALCKEIVEFHGGRIWIDTAYTGGTRFCFTLPAPAAVTDGEETHVNTALAGNRA